MTPIERKFAELAGKILGKRWFDKEQARKKIVSNAHRHKRKTPNSPLGHDHRNGDS